MSVVRITVEEGAGRTTLRIEGSLGVGEVPLLEPKVTTLMAARPARLIIDLRGLAFISSLGIGQVVMLCGNVKKRGGSAAVVCGDENVWGALERCKVNLVAGLARTMDQGLALTAPAV